MDTIIPRSSLVILSDSEESLYFTSSETPRE